MSLQEKITVVNCGSSGTGFAIAERLTREPGRHLSGSLSNRFCGRVVALVIASSMYSLPLVIAETKVDGGSSTVAVAGTMSVSVISSQPHSIPSEIHGTARLLIHTMPAFQGGTTKATTLLFLPNSQAPAGGWPIVGWIHGTTSTGKKDCAPSLSPQLDGGLTRDGFKSGYTTEIANLVNAGYAVVAPDLEGLGPVATEQYPYFSEASMARSIIAGVLAARQVEHSLSDRWVVFGHSDGAHGALGVERYASEAAELTFLGTVAAAPYTSVPGIGANFAVEARAVSDPATLLNARVMVQMQGAFMATALLAHSPGWDPSAIMGDDLKALMPAFRDQCSVGAFTLVKTAVGTKGDTFLGLKPDWAGNPYMHEFLITNDQGEMQDFMLHRAALIVQGTEDGFVSEPLNTALAAKLRDAGAPLTYKLYPGADHFSVLTQSNSDVLAFLKARFTR